MPMGRQFVLEGQFGPQPPIAPGSLKVPAPTDWTEVPLIADDKDGLPRRVLGRITASGNLEIGIESQAALEALRRQARSPSAPAPLPAGMALTEQRAFHRANTPRVPSKASGGYRAMEIPEELAPDVLAQRLALQQRMRLGLPLVGAQVQLGQIPLTAAGRPVPSAGTSPMRRAFATALVPGAALQALDAYLSKTHRADFQAVRAAAWALFTSRLTPLPLGVHVQPPGPKFTPSSQLFRRGVLGQAFVPGQFPPGYTVERTTVAPAVPVTTDTIAAIEFFARRSMRGGELRGRGVYRTVSPPRRTRIANYLSEARWRHCGLTPGFSVVLWCPPLGPPPTD